MSYVFQTLKRYRISINHFASMTGLGNSHLHKLKVAKHKPRLDTIKILAKGLERITGETWFSHADRIEKQL
jgi:predicted transcriptional regulator